MDASDSLRGSAKLQGLRGSFRGSGLERAIDCFQPRLRPPEQDAPASKDRTVRRDLDQVDRALAVVGRDLEAPRGKRRRALPGPDRKPLEGNRASVAQALERQFLLRTTGFHQSRTADSWQLTAIPLSYAFPDAGRAAGSRWGPAARGFASRAAPRRHGPRARARTTRSDGAAPRAAPRPAAVLADPLRSSRTDRDTRGRRRSGGSGHRRRRTGLSSRRSRRRLSHRRVENAPL